MAQATGSVWSAAVLRGRRLRLRALYEWNHASLGPAYPKPAQEIGATKTDVFGEEFPAAASAA